jgi:hypothetical protein
MSRLEASRTTSRATCVLRETDSSGMSRQQRPRQSGQ